MPEIHARWLRELSSGNDILVTPKMFSEDPKYRNALAYVKLDRPIPPDTPNAVEVVTSVRSRIKTAAKKKAEAAQKAPAKKAAKKKAAK